MPSHLIAITQKLSDPIDPGPCRDLPSPRTTSKECGIRTAVGTRSNSSSSLKLLAFTIDVDTPQIVKLESLDARCGRHELSEEEKTSLVHLRERLEEEM